MALRMRAGQGATEYLVLLAVVLIVALVSVALLGFFPGMASDAQITQSKAYWQSMQPISILEWDAMYSLGGGRTYPYLRIRNSGAYPIRLTGIIGGDGVKITQFYTDTGVSGCTPSVTGGYNLSDYYYMGPGEEKYFATSSMHGGGQCRRHIGIQTSAGGGYNVGGASSVCANSTTAPGTAVVSPFGFEYIEYIDGQQVTKREIGSKPLVIKCREPA